MGDNIFWTHDPYVLYKNNNYLEFIPNTEMTRIQQLNALTRFAIYFIFISSAMGKQEYWIHMGIILILFILVLYYTFEKNKNYQCNTQNIDNQEENNTEPFTIESGIYDFNGKLKLGKYYGSHSKSRTNSNTNSCSLNKKNKQCRYPTHDNPYMNMLQTDFNVEDPPQACNADDSEISEKINNSFNEDLFRDVSDVFDKHNSQRQFYTVPQLNPPDQHAFAHWLYGGKNACKMDQTKCLKYTDLKYAK